MTYNIYLSKINPLNEDDYDDKNYFGGDDDHDTIGFEQAFMG